MTKLNQYSRRIANYIYDDLKTEDREVFETDLVNDSDLAREFDRQSKAVNYLKAKSVLEDMRSDEDLEEARKVVDDHFSEPQDNHTDQEQLATKHTVRKVSRVLYPIIVAAAVFLGLLIIRNFTPGDLNERIYNSYYHPLDEVNYTLRGDEPSASSMFKDAIVLYQRGDFSNASILLSDLADINPQFPEPQFFLGLSQMGEGNFEKSSSILESYLAQHEKYKLEAEWYLALCYLKLDNTPQAIVLFEGLTDVRGAYGANSRRILKKLR